ncbi:MAG TPA: hypothetical protein VK020_10255 [Microlunatus sp.]|nr:hypothetical protein [Microlunatus sp.]
MTEFPVYQPSGRAGADPAAGSASTWCVLVEFSNHGEAKPPTLLDQVGGKYSDLESALTAARTAAFEYEPPDPFSPQARRVFRTGDREFLTVIDGAMSTFHFFTRVAEYLGEA